MKWPSYQLGEIAEISGGGTPRRDMASFWGGKIPWVTPTDLPTPGEAIPTILDTDQHITEEGLRSSSAVLVGPGTVLFSSRATIGKIAIAGVPLTTNQGFANLTPKPGMDSKYLAYALRFHSLQIESLSGATTFKEVRRSLIRQFKILVPPLSEQRKIVEILDQADELCLLRREADEKATRILPALFYEKFGDPTANEPSWPRQRIANVVAETQYGTSQKSNSDGHGVPVLRMNNINVAGELLLQDLKWVELDAAQLRLYRLNDGDILFNRTNSHELVGKTGLFRSDLEAVAASYLIRVKVDTRVITPEYLWAYMNSAYIKGLLRAKARRAIGMANINARELQDLPIVVPPLKEQQGFSSQVKALDALREHRRVAAARTEQLRTALVSYAFSGKLGTKMNVKEASK